MITKIKTIVNPYGSEGLEKLRQVLPTISKLNISERQLLLDGNRKSLYITGHKTNYRKAYIGITRIYLDGLGLRIKTTILLPHLLIGIILPTLAIVIVLVSSKSTIFSAMATSIFLLNPIYYIWDIIKQDKFGNEILEEIKQLTKQTNNENERQQGTGSGT
jgi:hypothetical protein